MEVLKKSKDKDFILSVSNEDDIEGEYVDPILPLVLTTSSDLISNTDVKPSFVIETEIPPEFVDPTLRTMIR